MTSTYPDEGTVTYQYGGDGKRRSRSVSGGAFTWYNWDIGYNMIEEEAQGGGLGNGTLAKTYTIGPPTAQGIELGSPMEGTLVGMAHIGTVLAEVAGTVPSSGNYSYYIHDTLDSVRFIYAKLKLVSRLPSIHHMVPTIEARGRYLCLQNLPA